MDHVKTSFVFLETIHLGNREEMSIEVLDIVGELRDIEELKIKSALDELS
jgi:hypothetical protein